MNFFILARDQQCRDSYELVPIEHHGYTRGVPIEDVHSDEQSFWLLIEFDLNVRQPCDQLLPVVLFDFLLMIKEVLRNHVVGLNSQHVLQERVHDLHRTVTVKLVSLIVLGQPCHLWRSLSQESERVVNQNFVEF